MKEGPIRKTNNHEKFPRKKYCCAYGRNFEKYISHTGQKIGIDVTRFARISFPKYEFREISREFNFASLCEQIFLENFYS